jgi:glutathione synthase
MYKIAIQLDDFNSLSPQTDTTLAISHILNERGHKLFYYHPRTLSLQYGKLYAYGCECILDLEAGNHEKIFQVTSQYHLELSEVDLILVRQDPPFDMKYLTSLYLLETISDKVLIFNGPSGIRGVVEKIFPVYFQEFLPKMVITGELQVAKNFAEQYNNIVIKSLYGHAGKDVKKILMHDPLWMQQIDEYIKKYNYIILQEYLPEVEKNGDKRVLLVNGKIMTAFQRLPKQGDFRANMAAGGSAIATELTPREVEICQTIAPFLSDKGIFLAGIDLLNEKLIEVNVTSPTGVKAASQIYHEDFALRIVEELESALENKS